MKNLTFSKRYDSVYKEGGQHSVWPWSTVVVFLNRLKKSLKKDSKNTRDRVWYGCKY